MMLVSLQAHVIDDKRTTKPLAVVQDYCAVLNLDTKVWTKQTIDAPLGTTLQRSRHSCMYTAHAAHTNADILRNNSCACQ